MFRGLRQHGLDCAVFYVHASVNKRYLMRGLDREECTSIGGHCDVVFPKNYKCQKYEAFPLVKCTPL